MLFARLARKTSLLIPTFGLACAALVGLQSTAAAAAAAQPATAGLPVWTKDIRSILSESAPRPRVKRAKARRARLQVLKRRPARVVRAAR